MSTNTGVAPALAMAPAVAKKVNGVVITSSPGPTPQASRALKKFYEYLVDESLLTGNPVIRRLRVREPDRLPRFLTPEEKEKVLAWFRDHAPPNVALAFHTLFASGLRLGECVALRPGDLLVRDNAYLLHVRLGKGAKGRLAPVVDRRTAFALAEFAPRRQGAERLFGVALYTLEWHARNCRLDTCFTKDTAPPGKIPFSYIRSP